MWELQKKKVILPLNHFQKERRLSQKYRLEFAKSYKGYIRKHYAKHHLP